MRVLLPAAFLLAANLAAADGYSPLFNGKDLTGWDGDPRLWSIANGVVTGTTDGTKIDHNTFLISKRTYANFDLRLEVRLRNHNSGIQIRSEALPEWVVRGLQADMAEDNWWGCLYDEKGKRGVVVNGWKGKAETVVKRGDWNRYEVHVEGDFIQLKVNGMVTVEYHDAGGPAAGVIALQLHAGPPMKVEFRNAEIRELP